MIKKIFFSSDPFSNKHISALTLILRLIIGGSMLTHGIEKLLKFETLAHTFPDPLGVGHTWSLLMALGAEVGCSLLIMMGLFTRLATIPCMFTMGVAFIVIHRGDAFASKELALIYFVVYLTLFTLGAGKYSLDKLIAR